MVISAVSYLVDALMISAVSYLVDALMISAGYCHTKVFY